MTGRVSFGRAPRILAIVIAAVWVVAALWATDGQMRESDQASLLEGALELARDPGAWTGNSSYNYARQYGSYWLLASGLRVGGALEPGVGLERIVRLGNIIAAAAFGAALLVVVATQRVWRWWTVAILGIVVLTPVFAFTGFLLSSNVFSAAFLFLLAIVLRYPGWWSTGVCFLLAFAATACRVDAALLMPLLALLALRPGSLRDSLRSTHLWALAGGSSLSIVLGMLLRTESQPLPEAFFVLPTFGAYLVFGLGGLVLAVVAFSGHLVRSRQWGLAGIGLAVLVPLLFYSQFLYTPRHLFATAIAILLTVLLPRGVEAWQQVVASRSGRLLVCAALLGTIIPWLVGVRVTSWTSGRPVARHATLFPSTDGFWPLGAYASFYHRLAHASRRPVDHNQEVWAAWSDPELELPSAGKGAITSSGLTSYASLAMAYHGRETVEESAGADYVLFDDRTLSKVHLGVNLTRTSASRDAQKLILQRGSRVIGKGLGRRSVVATDPGAERHHDDGVSLRLVLSQVYRGNDFRLARWEESDWWRSLPWDGHKVVVATRDATELEELAEEFGMEARPERMASAYDPREWWVLEVGPGDLARLDERLASESVWVACSTLPKFMDVGSYSK